MKQILFLFLTFCGICSACAQDAAPAAIRDSTKAGVNTVSVTPDSALLKKIPTIKLLANPVKNKAEITVANYAAGEVQVILSDSKGNRLRDDRRLLIGGSDIITIMFSLPAGIYFVTVKQKQKLATKKMIVR